MTFIGYDMGAKAYRFMCKDNSMVIAIKCLFDEDTFPRAKSEKGTSTQNKLKISPPGINDKDQEEIDIPPNPNTKDINHNHEDPHDKDTSDDTRSESQESSPSESCMDASPGYRWFESVSVSSGGCRSGIIISHGNISSSDSSGGMSKVVSRGTRVWFFQRRL